MIETTILIAVIVVSLVTFFISITSGCDEEKPWKSRTVWGIIAFLLAFMILSFLFYHVFRRVPGNSSRMAVFWIIALMALLLFVGGVFMEMTKEPSYVNEVVGPMWIGTALSAFALGVYFFGMKHAENAFNKNSVIYMNIVAWVILSLVLSIVNSTILFGECSDQKNAALKKTLTVLTIILYIALMAYIVYYMLH